LKRFTTVSLALFSACTLVVVLGSLMSVYAQAKKPKTLSELAAYTGADREQLLVAGAKAEGKVFWYTSLAGSSQRILENLEFGSPAKNVDFKRWYPEAGLNTDQYDKKATAWQKALRELGRK
jgi:hypothetical protein